MVEGSKKSRTQKRIFKKTPGGRTVVHYRKSRPSRPKCGECGAILHGVPAKRKNGLSKMSKTQKRPSRPYGGVLCSKCMRKRIVEEARK